MELPSLVKSTVPVGVPPKTGTTWAVKVAERPTTAGPGAFRVVTVVCLVMVCGALAELLV